MFQLKGLTAAAEPLCSIFSLSGTLFNDMFAREGVSFAFIQQLYFDIASLVQQFFSHRTSVPFLTSILAGGQVASVNRYYPFVCNTRDTWSVYEFARGARPNEGRPS